MGKCVCPWGRVLSKPESRGTPPTSNGPAVCHVFGPIFGHPCFGYVRLLGLRARFGQKKTWISTKKQIYVYRGMSGRIGKTMSKMFYLASCGVGGSSFPYYGSHLY